MNPWLQIYGGTRYYPIAPTTAMVNIDAIAHALGNICRYGGHSAWHYSVAQHSVLVSRLCNPRDAMWGLLHDAHEAFVADVPKPLKDHDLMRGYCEIEDRNAVNVCAAFGLDTMEPESVRIADKETSLAIEVKALMQPIDREWAVWINGVDVPANVRIEQLTPRQASEQFMARWSELNAAGRCVIRVDEILRKGMD